MVNEFISNMLKLYELLWLQYILCLSSVSLLYVDFDILSLECLGQVLTSIDMHDLYFRRKAYKPVQIWGLVSLVHTFQDLFSYLQG